MSHLVVGLGVWSRAWSELATERIGCPDISLIIKPDPYSVYPGETEKVRYRRHARERENAKYADWRGKEERERLLERGQQGLRGGFGWLSV